MTRRALTRVQRVKFFDEHKGICHFCDLRIHAERGELWEVSHPIPLEAGGEDVPENRRPAHKTCHRAHTSAVDIPLIAKVRRQRAAHLGIKAPKQAIQSRGFPKRDPKPRKPTLPYRSLYSE